MLPLAVTNIRANVLPQVFATDASGWGEAEVSCKIPPKIAQEAIRHTLRKSVWVRLLSPLQALARTQGVLEAEEELPGDHCFSMHPLWEVLIRCPQYHLCWKAASSKRRRINVSELRAFLRSERRQGVRHPQSRALRASDSQVTLGCVLKGRSSSKALNQELRQSLPNIIGNDVYSEGFYVDTKLNPGDDPTRGADIRAPSLDYPVWWDSASQGDLHSFDEWLQEAGRPLHVQLGVPEPGELLGADWQCSQALPRTEGPSMRGGVSDKDRLSGSHDPSEVSPIQSSRDHPTTQHTERGSKPDKISHAWFVSSFDPDITECLRSFKCSHFVWPPATDGSGRVRFWDFSKPGYLDLFSGCRGVAKVVSKAADTWALCVDISDDPQLDLLRAELREKIEYLTSKRVFFAVGAAPVCGSFSIAVTPAVRDKTHPQGKPEISNAMEIKVQQGNSFSRWLSRIASLCLTLDLVFWIENPQRSWLWEQTEWAPLRRDSRAGFWEVTFCAFNAPWKKGHSGLHQQCVAV